MCPPPSFMGGFVLTKEEGPPLTSSCFKCQVSASAAVFVSMCTCLWAVEGPPQVLLSTLRKGFPLFWNLMNRLG